MSQFSDYTATFVKESDKGLCIIVDGDKVWLPKSQLRNIPEVKLEGDEITFEISLWLLGKAGLDETD